MYKIGFFLMSLSLLSGCAGNYVNANRIDETKALNNQHATVVGFVSEGYLTQPHGLNVLIKQEVKNTDETPTLVLLTTIGQKDEVTSNNILGNSFAYQIPAGTYDITSWYYYHYNGTSKNPEKPIKFSVKPGEIAYIGNIHGNALTMCLSNSDKYNESISTITLAYPTLKNTKIINKSTEIQFSGWPHDNSTDVMGKGLCKTL
ncbi:hypothetical protein [Pseudomonas sp.]|jgi:hypothetical protein|uniref:hypothetical protein n=1 Tax=Pseudomonas sp. TaxID=306 RepID=UPI00398281AF